MTIDLTLRLGGYAPSGISRKRLKRATVWVALFASEYRC